MIKSILTAVILLWALSLQAQTCGFGCLGMSGFYGGYTIQEFNATELNKTIVEELRTNQLKEKFGRAQGYRVGANIFRANFSGYFITAKGFYQFLNEEHSYLINNSPTKYKAQLNYWGLGLDLGIPIFSLLDFKLIEGGATIFSSKLEISEAGASTPKKFESVKTDLSYYVGTGLIFHIIPNYISLEGTAFYTIFNIDRMEDTEGNQFGSAKEGEAIFSGKKFGATVQLNLGLPL